MRSSKYGDNGASYFFVSFSLAIVALIFLFLWQFGLVQDTLTAAVASGAIVLYVLISAFVFPGLNGSGTTLSHAKFMDSPAKDKIIRAWFLFLPGYFISQTVLRFFGRGTFAKN